VGAFQAQVRSDSQISGSAGPEPAAARAGYWKSENEAVDTRGMRRPKQFGVVMMINAMCRSLRSVIEQLQIG